MSDRDENDSSHISVPINEQPIPPKRNIDHVKNTGSATTTTTTNGSSGTDLELNSIEEKTSPQNEQSVAEINAKAGTPSGWVQFENDDGESDKVNNDGFSPQNKIKFYSDECACVCVCMGCTYRFD